MNSKLTGALAATLALASATAGSVPVAMAQSDNAAIVIHRDGCGGFIPSVNGTIAPPFWTDPDGNWRSVRTSADTWVFTCNMQIPAALVPNEVRRAQGFLCGSRLSGLWTRDTFAQATPGGQFRISCRITGATEPAF